MTSVRLESLNGRFYSMCTVHGNGERRLLALVDPGSTVTMVRGDICANLGLKNARERIVSCVHASHADVVVQKRFCTMTLGAKSRHIAVFELGWINEGGRHLEAILGLDMLEVCRVTLDWRRMEGILET